MDMGHKLGYSRQETYEGKALVYFTGSHTVTGTA